MSPIFSAPWGVLLAQGVSRSDYLVLPDPLVENTNIFPPGQYFWRVRAVHGDVFGPWSSRASFNVVASLPTPPGLQLFSIVVEPGSVSGGNSTQARVVLNAPAGPGGALVNIAPDLPHVQTPRTVLVPEGKTDATVSPITTIPVGGATVGTITAAYGLGWQQNSIALWPILWGLSLSTEGVVGGNSVTGTLTLLNPAPPGGVEVTIISSDTTLAAPPAKVTIPAGAFGVTFTIPTAPVSVPVRVVFSSGTAFEGFRAPDTWLALLPAGSPDPAPSLASLSLSSSTVLGGGALTGTATLTGPATAGGALVRLSGSMEGQVVTPQNVTVSAGSATATFTITAPQVNTPHYILIQGTYGTSGGNQAQLLEVDPNFAGTPTLFAMGINSSSVIGGNSLTGTVQLVMPAPAGGAAVALSSDNAAAQVPATVAVAAGNSANSFTVTTTPVTLASSANITATVGGVTKSFFINLAPDPNAPPLLQSVSVTPTSVPGGTSATGTVFLSAPAPAGGASATLATSSLTATAPGVVIVPAGQTSATFTVTTVAVQSSTVVTLTAILGSASRTASLTVTAGGQPPTPGTPSLLSPANGATPAQPVTLDWSDASNAASYEIQVDDSSNFTTPLIRSLTSTVSQTTVTGLPTVQLFWRVRAKNSAGVAGNWSAARRFTPQAAPAAPTLSSLSLNPASVVGGSTSQGTVTLSSAAPSGGAVVALSSSAPSVASTPASVTVTAGATSATFTITTVSVTGTNSVTISGSFGGVTRTAALTVTLVPLPPPPASLLSLTLNPPSVMGGNTSQGMVTLTSAAPSGAAVVALSSSNTNAATVPASVTVAAGATSANFMLTSRTVASATSVTVSATYSSVTRNAMLTVNPAPAGPLPAPGLLSPAADARFAPGANITFDWSDVSGAASYTIQIDDNNAFPSPWIVNQTVALSTFSTSTLPTLTMWWRVRANDASGNSGAWSSVRRFEVKN